MSPLGFALGAAGGASTGFAPALENIMRMRQEKAYQDRSLGLEERGLDLDERVVDIRRDELSWQKFYDTEELRQLEKERGGIRVGGRTFDTEAGALRWAELLSDSRRSSSYGDGTSVRVGGRDFPDTEAGRAQALEWQRQLSGASRSPGDPPDRTSTDLLPGETPYDRLIRLQEAYGLPISELRRRFQWETEDATDSEIRRQVRDELRGGSRNR